MSTDDPGFFCEGPWIFEPKTGIPEVATTSRCKLPKDPSQKSKEYGAIFSVLQIWNLPWNHGPLRIRKTSSPTESRTYVSWGQKKDFAHTPLSHGCSCSGSSCHLMNHWISCSKFMPTLSTNIEVTSPRRNTIITWLWVKSHGLSHQDGWLVWKFDDFTLPWFNSLLLKMAIEIMTYFPQ